MQSVKKLCIQGSHVGKESTNPVAKNVSVPSTLSGGGARMRLHTARMKLVRNLSEHNGRIKNT